MSYLLVLIGITMVFGAQQNLLISPQVLAKEVGIDWWNVLNADTTCCPLNTDEQSCNAEAGSSCKFLKPNNPIAIAAGSQCVGVAYIKCKRVDITACCTPACNPPPAGQPAPPAPPGPGVTPPVCGPAPVTPEPTPRPTTPQPTTPEPTPRPTPRPTTPEPTPNPTTSCTLGVNYAFEGASCKISGDPHTTIYNGNKHDFQGTPTVVVNGVKRNQFYYIHPCAGESNDDMPLKVAGTHYHWGSRSVSGIDYLTIILSENGGANKYQLYLSSSLASVADVSTVGASSDYDMAVADGATLQTLQNGNTLQLGTRFKVYYNSYNSNKKSYFKITIDNTMEFKLYMQGQTTFVNGRYRMHYVSLTVPSLLKCYACGLCGDFNIFTTGLKTESMEACDGTLIDYRAGWNPKYTPEAYDTYGWTWEKNYVDNSCSNNYDNTDNILGNETPTDPCDATIADQVATECENAIAAKSTCCAQIGNNFCDGLLTDCKVDACAGANGDVTAIADEIQTIIIDPIDAVCADENLQDDPDAIPPPELECPTGSIVVNTNGNNDIGGTGLDTARFNVGDIEDCELKCQRNADCDAFSFAPIGGDHVYPTTTVCTLYDSDVPTNSHGPNQIFCKIVPKTCTLTAYTMVDDNQYIYRSDDDGDTFEQKNYKEGWGQLITTTFASVTTKTVIKAKAQNTGGPGGFIAKFVLSNDNPSITKTKTIITDNPLSTMRVEDINGNTLNTASLTYTNLGGGAWGQLNPTSRPQVAGASWTLIPVTTYNFYLSLSTADLEEAGCIVRTREVIQDFTCLTRTGSSSSNPSSPSSVSCQTGETLVSCGLNGVHQVQGTTIDPAQPNTCIAGTSVTSYSVRAVAVCCTFPQDSINGITTITGTNTDTNSRQVITECPAGSALTGCQVNYISGGDNQIRGTYPGPNQGINSAPSQTGVSGGIDTENQCVAEARIDGVKIGGSAQCLEINTSDYEFECVTTAKYTNKNGFNGECPTDYTLLACQTYTKSNTLDAWYLTTSGGCYVQQDSHASQYANGICCKLTQILQNPSNNKYYLNIKIDEIERFNYNYNAGLIVILLCVIIGGLYYRYIYNKNKNDGYKPISGIDSEENNPFLKV